jgi:alkaline phosphatase
VVFFVGDGLGVATHTMARIHKGQKAGQSGEEGSLAWEDWDYSGLIKVAVLSSSSSLSLAFLVSIESVTALARMIGR